MVLIKKNYQTLKVIRRNMKGDYLISIENSVAPGSIIKCYIVLNKKEFGEMLDDCDKLEEIGDKPEEIDGAIS